MKVDYKVGETYKSVTHGLVVYKGLDHAYGQTTLMFYSPEYGMKYWLPETLLMHFGEPSKSRDESPKDIKDVLARLFQDTCGAVPQTTKEIELLCDYNEAITILQGIAYSCDLVEEEFEGK